MRRTQRHRSSKGKTSVFPFIARAAAVMVAGKLIARVAQHPRLAPLASSRKGRLALLALGWGMRRHRRTRLAGSLVRHVVPSR
jgi:hypothetical protein